MPAEIFFFLPIPHICAMAAAALSSLPLLCVTCRNYFWNEVPYRGLGAEKLSAGG